MLLPLKRTGLSLWMISVWQTWLCQGWFSQMVTWDFVFACSVKVWKEGEMACSLALIWWCASRWMMKIAEIQYINCVAIVVYPFIWNKECHWWIFTVHMCYIIHMFSCRYILYWQPTLSHLWEWLQVVLSQRF